VEASPELQESGYDLDRVLVGIDLSYEVDLWGRLRGLSEAAKNDLLASEEGTRTVFTTLVSDVARAYFELRALDEELAITERRRGVRRESAQLVSAREGGGVSSLLEVHQAEAELTTTSAQVPELRRKISLKEHELSVLLGRMPGPIPRAAFREASDAPSPPFLSPGLPTHVLARRPDIRAAERQLAAAHGRVEAARTAYFPKITLDGFIGLGASAFKSLFDGDAFAAALTYGVFQPILDPGRRKGRIELEKGRREEALAAYQKSIQQAFREVADAMVGEQRLREVREEQDHLVTVLTGAQRLSDERYRSGVTSYLEVLDVSRQLYNAELSRARTRRDQLVTSVQLYRALGGGWRTDTTAKPNGGAAPGKR
jgi:multidrug efflux system outer membrane protein